MTRKNRRYAPTKGNQEKKEKKAHYHHMISCRSDSVRAKKNTTNNFAFFRASHHSPNIPTYVSWHCGHYKIQNTKYKIQKKIMVTAPNIPTYASLFSGQQPLSPPCIFGRQAAGEPNYNLRFVHFVICFN